MFQMRCTRFIWNERVTQLLLIISQCSLYLEALYHSNATFSHVRLLSHMGRVIYKRVSGTSPCPSPRHAGIKPLLFVSIRISL